MMALSSGLGVLVISEGVCWGGGGGGGTYSSNKEDGFNTSGLGELKIVRLQTIFSLLLHSYKLDAFTFSIQHFRDVQVFLGYFKGQVQVLHVITLQGGHTYYHQTLLRAQV